MKLDSTSSKSSERDNLGSISALQITATALLKEGDESFYDVKFRAVDGTDRSRLVGRELFENPKRVVEILLKAHADFSGSAPIKQITTALTNRSSDI